MKPPATESPPPAENTKSAKVHKSRRRKILSRLLLAAILIVLCLLAMLSYLFVDLPQHKLQIQRIIRHYSGYQLEYKELHSGFNSAGEPWMELRGIVLKLPHSSQPLLEIGQLELSLAYRSLWQLSPCLSRLKIQATRLNFEFDKQSNLLLNQQILTNLASPSLSPSFDWEKFILDCQRLELKEITLGLVDSKHTIRPLNISDLQLDLVNQEQQHRIHSSAHLARSNLELELNFVGTHLTALSSWQKGELQLRSLDQKGYILALDARVRNGSLRNAALNFDTNQQKLTKISPQIASVKNFSGNIQLEQTAASEYKLTAQNLVIDTHYGYLFKQASILAQLDLEHGGQLTLSNLDLDGVNSLLNLAQLNAKFELHGMISDLNVSWRGRLAHAESLNLSGHFNDLALKSDESNLPSLNHISGKFSSGLESGNLSLKLADSQLNYPKYLTQALRINSFNTSFSWQIESLQLAKFGWDNLQLQTADLEMSSNGYYQIKPRWLFNDTLITRFNLAALGNYLPANVARPTRGWLQRNLTRGTINQLRLNFAGNPTAYPFQHESGSVTLTGRLSHAELKFLPGWESIKDINVQIAGKNQQLNLTLNSAELGKIHLSDLHANLSQLAESSAQLNASAKINSRSENYLDYLRQSPYAAQIAQLSQQIELSGNSTTTLKLALRLKNLASLQLTGNYEFESNSVAIKARPELDLSNLNGQLNFTQHGLTASHFNATGLNSNLALDFNRQYQLALSSPDLDYGRLAQLAYPQLSTVISGRAATLVNYNPANQAVNLHSDLVGVRLNLPEPLGKTESEAQSLQIEIHPNASHEQEINLAYAQRLYARLFLSDDYAFRRLNLALGTTNYQLDNPIEHAKITLAADFERLALGPWLRLANQLTATTTATTTATQNSPATHQLASESATTRNNREESELELFAAKEEQLEEHLASESNPIYPIQLQIKSNSFWVQRYNLDGGSANIVILPERINAEINTPDIRGSASYLAESHELFVTLDKLLFSSANLAHLKESAPALVQATSSTIAPVPLSLPTTNPSQESAEHLMAVESSNESATVESSNKSLAESTAAPRASSTATPDIPELPIIHLAIRQLYYQNHFLGSLNGEVYQQGNALYMNNFMLRSLAGTTRINLTDHGLGGGESSEFVALNLHADINNFGNYILKFNQGDMFSKGSGVLDMGLSWRGGLADFAPVKVVSKAELNLHNGQLDHVNPGLFGTLMGVINLRPISITNLDQFNFNSFFGKGLVYDSLTTKLYLKANQLKIEDLKLAGQAATVSSFGTLNLDSNQIDSYLTVQPRLGSTVAATATIVTLNPIIGAFVYLGDFLIGDPINKAFAISYHISGQVESPTMTRTSISKQLIKNFNSSLNIFGQ